MSIWVVRCGSSRYQQISVFNHEVSFLSLNSGLGRLLKNHFLNFKSDVHEIKKNVICNIS